ncbi:amino acid ABC transporter membrane protein 1 (PAAT family) [Paracoccus pantotrophus]|uniref:ABC transporter permease subunit n=1 Tax=Paracoccus pantotrophus TaxID=82367 RepID=A0AAE6NTB0_PARPN|nr:ABC transporter permease subunit [Paracoccus pantotrophus]MDF3854058.1 ABC transporter permease subunit [Paracoccus pantotrophus]QFG35989.1 ABC transporter permease subunit [Paracoccus pantotrophus]RDD97596.1 ABC transporter permease subunit [Paracoccus pantotrophus]RKS44819.1 amino acid ABC transporter membrane protein 1 (PAAT family) [Paracoccus pantotrophus]RNI16902.1 ABC transporter permease subunit [Paracoccus pantotrophus]
MFSHCTDPSALDGLAWLSCYLTTGNHMLFYASFGTVLLLLAITAPAALIFGFGGAMASRSRIAGVRWFGRIYTSMVRGVPDIIFFLFVPIALDQGFEWLRSRVYCDPSVPVRQGNEFIVCAAAKLPLSTSPEWVHQAYGIFLAVIAFAVVFGAFAANVLHGAMNAVPKAQLETAEAYGMSPRQVNRRILIPQMWTYALPGLANLWMILIKATPLLFVLGVEDIVYWARELGGAKTRAYAYPHPDWRLYYFLAILAFYLLMTWGSERIFDRIRTRLSRGQATAAGEAMRKAAT